MQLNRIQCDRRTFLQLSRSGAAATAAPLSLISERPFTQMFSQVAPAASSSDNLLERMTWLSEPASSRRSGDQLLVRSRSKTDFWRKTLYGYITDNGHFFGLAASGDFMFQAREWRIRSAIRSGRTHGSLECRELDEMRNRILRWPPPRQCRFYA